MLKMFENKMVASSGPLDRLRAQAETVAAELDATRAELTGLRCEATEAERSFASIDEIERVMDRHRDVEARVKRLQTRHEIAQRQIQAAQDEVEASLGVEEKNLLRKIADAETSGESRTKVEKLRLQLRQLRGLAPSKTQPLPGEIRLVTAEVHRPAQTLYDPASRVTKDWLTHPALQDRIRVS